MSSDLRVELQAEVPGRREDLFGLVGTADGLRRWLDSAELQPAVGGSVRLGMQAAVAFGTVLALDAPQHISWTFDWEAEPLHAATVLAFDLIDHSERTHLTLRHVGLRTRAQRELHDALWRYWFRRLVRAARAAAARQPAPVR
jgi:uncharacterized protein YndB with AHSA1/START domain